MVIPQCAIPLSVLGLATTCSRPGLTAALYTHLSAYMQINGYLRKCDKRWTNRYIDVIYLTIYVHSSVNLIVHEHFVFSNIEFHMEDIHVKNIS